MTEVNKTMAAALIAAQKRVLIATKDGSNPAFKSKYATLDSVLEAVRGPLAENGFALIQDATSTRDSVSVVTRLLHESGGVIESQPLCAPLKDEFTREGKTVPPSVQQIGALVTYLRRYSICPFLGVALDDDDDGNRVSQIGKDGPAADKKPEAAPAGAERRKSAHTGEPLNAPGAAERHHAAADAARAAPAQAQPAAPAKPGIPVDAQERGTFNAGLMEAMEKAGVTDLELENYLKGNFGEPRIQSPVLAQDMTVRMLGERIVNALLNGVSPAGRKNWDMVVERIKAGRK